MHMVTKRLVVGNIDDANHLPPQVGALLLVAEEQDVSPPSGIAYTKLPFKEFDEPQASLLCQAVDWIEGHIAKNRIMVCCRAGMGRSVSVVIAYLCCIEGLNYEQAVKLVLTRRPGGVPLPRLSETIAEVRALRLSRSQSPSDDSGAAKSKAVPPLP
jgi:protein-tyrosine phosphatase